MQKFIIFGSNPVPVPEILTKSGAPEFHAEEGFNPLEAALGSDADSLLLFGSKGDALWSIRVRHVLPKAVPDLLADNRHAYNASGVGTGFLGLTDPFESEPEPPKKWWQRLLD